MAKKIDTKTSTRGRGRPKGSAPFKQGDLSLLRQVAKQLAQHPDLNLTKLLRRLGVQEESALSRLRKRWREQGQGLLDQARSDLYDRQASSGFGKALLMFDAFAVRLHEILGTVSLPEITSRIQAHREIQDAKRRLGQDRDVGFDTINAEEIVAAIGRLEARDPVIQRRIEQAEDQGVDLSDWQHQYVMAVVLHEMALEGRKKEQEINNEPNM